MPLSSSNTDLSFIKLLSKSSLHFLPLHGSPIPPWTFSLNIRTQVSKLCHLFLSFIVGDHVITASTCIPPLLLIASLFVIHIFVFHFRSQSCKYIFHTLFCHARLYIGVSSSLCYLCHLPMITGCCCASSYCICRLATFQWNPTAK